MCSSISLPCRALAEGPRFKLHNDSSASCMEQSLITTAKSSIPPLPLGERKPNSDNWRLRGFVGLEHGGPVRVAWSWAPESRSLPVAQGSGMSTPSPLAVCQERQPGQQDELC